MVPPYFHVLNSRTPQSIIAVKTVLHLYVSLRYKFHIIYCVSCAFVFFSKARLLTAILNVFSFDSVFFFFILGNMTNSANYNVNMSSREGHHL